MLGVLVEVQTMDVDQSVMLGRSRRGYLESGEDIHKYGWRNESDSIREGEKFEGMISYRADFFVCSFPDIHGVEGMEWTVV